jgi:hypothetical protein
MHDVPANPLEKPGYILEWHDEFAGPDIDRSKWLTAYLPQWSSRQRSEPRYLFREHALVLQITHDQQPWCPEFDGDVKASSIQTGVFAGPVGSTEGQHRFNPQLVVREAQTNTALYTPRYGYFECRAKAIATPGYLVSLWMIGYEDQPHRSGELCMFEIFGTDVSATVAKVGMGIHPYGDPQLVDEFVQQPVAMDATVFHIYALEWTPTQVDFYVDNQKIKTVHQSPEYPMQFMLSLYELPGAAGQAGYPQEFAVDYVRAYQPQGGYAGAGDVSDVRTDNA